MYKCKFVLTDSGGIQEEAPSLNKPVLVMRETTERHEGEECGTITIVGTNTQKIVKTAQILLDNKTEYKRIAAIKNPYGDGTASQQIATHFSAILSL